MQLLMEYGIVDEKTIDNINILQATKLAVTKSIQNLAVKPDYILVDALTGINTCRYSISIDYKRRFF